MGTRARKLHCEKGKTPDVQVIDDLLCMSLRLRKIQFIDDLTLEEYFALQYLKKRAKVVTLRLTKLMDKFGDLL